MVGLGASVFVSRSVGTSAGGSVLNLGSRILWDNVGGDPVVVTIDGAEHVVGRLRDLSNEGQLSIHVIDSGTLKTRWRTPNLGTYSEAYQAVHFGAAGGRLAVSDRQNTLHIYDLSSGKELKTHQVTDRIDQICPIPAKNQIWVQVVDKRDVLFDVVSFAASEAPRPEHCPQSVFLARHAPPRLDDTAGIPTVTGFDPKRVLVQGEIGVIHGAKQPGTPIPMAVGFDPATRKVRWTRPIPQVDPTSIRTTFESYRSVLAGNRFVAAYGVGSKAWHLSAMDARTGDPLWDVTLRPLFAVDHINGLVATTNRIYLVRMSSLEIFTASEGKLLGTIGSDTYER